ncbi:DUF3289 family protein [Cronobacter malonaticus]
MSGLAQPLTVFTSQKPFNDRNADDMKCGDLDEKTLKERFKLYQCHPLLIIVPIALPMITRRCAALRLIRKKE